MVLNRISKFAEGTFLVGAKVFQKISGLPRKLYEEAVEFQKRNGLGVVACSLETKEHIEECCPHCLKAHLLKKAEKMNHAGAMSKIIIELGEYENGHGGYYLDAGEVRKV